MTDGTTATTAIEFVKLSDNTYWRVDRTRQRVYNYNRGHQELSDISIKDTIYAESWYDLYLKTGYCCLETGLYHSLWLSPDGIPYPANAHYTKAEAICEVLYNDPEKETPEDFLIDLGWVKLTNSLMLDYYAEQGYYRNLTKAQYDTLVEFCDTYYLDLSRFNATVKES